MRKQELIHLHELLVLVRAHLEETTAVPPAAFRAYDESAIRPTAIHRQKRAHRYAIGLALDGAVAVIETDTTEERAAEPEPRPER